MEIHHFEPFFLPTGAWMKGVYDPIVREGRWHLMPKSPDAIDWLNTLGISELKLRRALLPVSFVWMPGKITPAYALRLGHHHELRAEDRYRICREVTERFEELYRPELQKFFSNNGKFDPKLVEAESQLCVA